MNLEETNSYSVGSIRTTLEIFLEKNNPKLHKQMERDLTRLKFLIKKAEVAMDEINSLMQSGYTEQEAWEIVSRPLYQSLLEE